MDFSEILEIFYEYMELITAIVITIAVIAALYFTSFITRERYDVRFNSPKQFNNLKKFLRKHKMKYKVISSNGNDIRIKTINEQINMQSGYIRINHPLNEIIERIYFYGKAKKFFSSENIIENSYFKAEYSKHYLILTDYGTEKKLQITKYWERVWFEIVKNITDDLTADELWRILTENNLVGKTNVSTKKNNYTSKKERIEQKKSEKQRNKRKQRSKKRRLFDVNNCTLEQLNNLNGINIITAKRLIKYRDENGGFASVDDFWKQANLSEHLREQIEKNKFIKTKKVKNPIIRKIENVIAKTIERVVDI